MALGSKMVLLWKKMIAIPFLFYWETYSSMSRARLVTFIPTVQLGCFATGLFARRSTLTPAYQKEETKIAFYWATRC